MNHSASRQLLCHWTSIKVWHFPLLRFSSACWFNSFGCFFAWSLTSHHQALEIPSLAHQIIIISFFAKTGKLKYLLLIYMWEKSNRSLLCSPFVAPHVGSSWWEENTTKLWTTRRREQPCGCWLCQEPRGNALQPMLTHTCLQTELKPKQYFTK